MMGVAAAAGASTDDELETSFCLSCLTSCDDNDGCGEALVGEVAVPHALPTLSPSSALAFANEALLGSAPTETSLTSSASLRSASAVFAVVASTAALGAETAGAAGSHQLKMD